MCEKIKRFIGKIKKCSFVGFSEDSHSVRDLNCLIFGLRAVAIKRVDQSIPLCEIRCPSLSFGICIPKNDFSLDKHGFV